jgi:integrase
MDNPVASRSFGVKGFVAKDVPTLQGVLDRLDERSELPTSTRQDLRSAVRKVADVLGLPPGDVPANPGFLRQRLAKVGPAAHGISKARWANIRSLLLRALRLAGVTVLPNRYMAPLVPAWKELDDKLKSHRSIRLGLSRFMHFASAQDVMPEQVDDGFVADYRRALDEEGVVDDWATLWRNTLGFWNRAVREIDGWPQRLLTVPQRAGRYWLRWEELPHALRLDAEAWLAREAGDLFLAATDRKPLRPATLESHRKIIRSYVSALSEAGYDLARLRSLKDLVEIEAVKTAMRFYHRRAGNRTTGRMLNEARLMLAIAKHWARVPQGQLEELQEIAKACDPGISGMTPRNQELLRCFDSEAAKRRLVDLPHRLIEHIPPGRKLGYDEAFRVKQALVVQLLLVAPMRLANLISLELERHFAAPSGPGGERLVILSPSETKNSEGVSYLLSSYSTALLQLYLERARPVLVSGPSIYLFPGKDCQTHTAHVSMRHLVTSVTFREVGVRIHPHAFRHLAGKFVLDVRPDAHELVRALLGHKRLETTLRYYTRMNQERAARQYDQLIGDLRGSKRLEG